MSELIVAAIIGALAGFLTALVTILAGRKKTDAEASKAISEAVGNLLEPLNRRIDDQEAEISSLRMGVAKLISQLRRCGIEPVWTPEMITPEEDRKNGRTKK